MHRRVIFIWILFFCFGNVLAMPDMFLEITTKLNNTQGEFPLYLGTSPSATSGIDPAWDSTALPGSPLQYSFLLSIIGASELIIDYWNPQLDSSRELELVYEVAGGSSPNGVLNLSWNPLFLRDSDGLGQYSFTLVDYGNDGTFSGAGGTRTSMNDESKYSVSNTFTSRYFKIETNYFWCGDSIITSSLGEQCEGADLDGKSCTSYPGYSSGTLSCNSNNCRFNFAQCSFPNGTTGPSNDGSPGGGSSGGTGGGSTCANECNLGERRCADDSSYQICGNFDSDGCSEWGSTEVCLGVNPSCRNGFCYGCLTDSECGVDSFCIRGRCETGCGKSCAQLNLFCGSHLVCGQILNCGSCENGFCNRGSCSDVPEDALKISQKACSPSYVCSPWSECEVSFDAQSLLSGKEWFEGKKTRLCFDSNECYSTLKQEEDCMIKLKTYSENKTICGAEYIEVYDSETDKLLSRIKDSRYSSRKAVEIFLMPLEIDCDEEFEPFKVSFYDRVMFSLDLRKIWRIVK